MKSLVFIGLILAQVFFANAGLMSNRELRQNFQFTDVTPGQRIRHYEAQVWPDLANARALALLGVQAEVTGENSGEVDAVAFALSNVLQTAIAFGYYHAEGSVSGLGSGNVTGNIDGSAFALLWRAFHVFEFVDNNGVNGFQPDADNITGAYDLSSIFLPWDPIQIDVQNVTTPDNQETRLFIVSMQTSDEVFFLRFTCVGYPAQVGGVKITPDSIKIDIRIRYFGNPYYTSGSLYATGPSSEPNAQVGLSSALGAWAASVSIENGATDNTPSLQLTTDNFAGFFNWEGQAGVVVGGVEVGRAVTGVVVPIDDPSIQAAFAGGWVAQVILFSFQGTRPTEVNWDPEMGANIDYAGLSAGVALQPTIFVALVSFFFVFFKNF